MSNQNLDLNNPRRHRRLAAWPFAGLVLSAACGAADDDPRDGVVTSSHALRLEQRPAAPVVLHRVGEDNRSLAIEYVNGVGAELHLCFEPSDTSRPTYCVTVGSFSEGFPREALAVADRLRELAARFGLTYDGFLASRRLSRSSMERASVVSALRGAERT